MLFKVSYSLFSPMTLLKMPVADVGKFVTWTIMFVEHIALLKIDVADVGKSLREYAT